MHEKKPLSIEFRGSMESPFLDQELFVESGDPKSERRAAALAAGSPFQSAFEEGWRSFDALTVASRVGKLFLPNAIATAPTKLDLPTALP